MIKEAVKGQASIKLVEQNFALFSKELVDLALGETAGRACQLIIRAKVKTVPTDPPNMTSQI